jgi:hypothetical protein
MNLALLINFGANSLQYKRIVLWSVKNVNHE